MEPARDRAQIEPSDVFGRLRWPRATARLVLRPVTVADAPAAHRYRGDPGVTRYLSHGPLSLAEVVARHEDRERRMLAGAADPLLGLAIVVDGRLVGDCMLRVEPQDGWTAWIGYALSPDVQGRGVGTEVARELLAVANEVGLRRVRARVARGNAASRRVLEKVGLREVTSRPAGPSLVYETLI